MLYTRQNKNMACFKRARPPILIVALLALTALSVADELGSYVDYSDELTANISFAKNSKNFDPKISHLIDLAETDHIALLNWAMEQYKQNIRDYIAVLHKQERIRGNLLAPQSIAIWFKENPFSVVMRWKNNATVVDKLLYVEGNRKNNHMYVHPVGMFSWIKSVKKPPRCKEATANSLRTCDQFGFYRSMEALMDIYRSVPTDQIKIKCIGPSQVFGRDCIAAISAVPASRRYPYQKIIMQFDIETLLPVGLSVYDRNNNLQCKYFFSDLKVNVGIPDRFFTRKAHKM